MHSKTVLTSLFILMSAVGACSSTPDDERAELRASLASARSLAQEVQVWRRGVAPNVQASVVKTVDGFRTRADRCLGTLSGMSDKATTGIDLAGAKQALSSLAEFDVSRLADASEPARNSLLDQFAAVAQSLESAVQRVQSRMA